MDRPVYSEQEIEEICLDELRKLKLLPSEPSAIRIERFVEKRFGVSPTYEDLPEGLLGFTKFGSNGVEKIVVARSLAEEGSKVAERRVNTTLAHEAGHGILHAHLFALGAQSASLFDGQVDANVPKILCRDGDVSGTQKRSSYDGRWWEYQANKVIGALLLPQPLVEKCLEGTLTTVGLFGVARLKKQNRQRAISQLSEVFDVNPIVAKIRVDQLYPEKDEAQLTL